MSQGRIEWETPPDQGDPHNRKLTLSHIHLNLCHTNGMTTENPAGAPPTTGTELSTRMDRLPFTRKHLHILTSSGIGWALDALDVALISYVVVVLKVHWDLSASAQSWIVSLGFIGMTLGAIFGGRMADRFGRRTIFAVTLLVFGIASAVAAFAPGLTLFLIMRLFVGFGIGAELPVASTYVSEFAPPRIRGRIVVILEAFWAVGWLGAALLGYYVVPHFGDWGWRLALLVGALPALYAAFVRAGLPESIRFLAGRGRVDEATRVVTAFEASAPLRRAAGPQRSGQSGTRLLTATAPAEHSAAEASATARPTAASAAESGAQAPAVKTRFADLWASGQARNSTALSLVWFFVNFSYYGAFIWIPSILHAQGYDIVKSFGFTLIITLAQLPGYAVAAWLVEQWGRRWTLAVFLLGSAGSALAFGNAHSVAWILITGCLLSFFNLGAWGALYAISPEVFPTHLRGTGTGWAAGFGRIASIIAPLLVPAVLAAAWGGAGVLFTVFALSFLVAAMAALFLSEQTGQALRD